MSGARIQVTYQVHTARRRHAIALEDGPRPQLLVQVPRVARLLAQAHHFERLLEQGIVRTQGELAKLAGVTDHPCDPEPEPASPGPRHSGGVPVSASGRARSEPSTERTLRYVLRTSLWNEQGAR